MRMRTATCTLAIALVASTARAESTSRDSTCTIRETGRDSVQVVVVANAEEDTIGSGRRRLRLSPDFLPYVVEAVRMHFRAPSVLPLPVMDASIPNPGLVSSARGSLVRDSAGRLRVRITRLLAVDAYFTLSSRGAPRDVMVTHLTMSDPFESSIRDAINAIVPDDYGIFPQGAEGARIHLQMHAVPFDPTLAQPFFTTWLSVYTLQAYATAGHDAHPVFPELARRAYVGDTVDARFVIDETGRVPLDAMEIIRVHYRDFMEPVAHAIARSGYRPAIVDGCPAKTVVYREFIFGFNR